MDRGPLALLTIIPIFKPTINVKCKLDINLLRNFDTKYILFKAFVVVIIYYIFYTLEL